jgi:hypothetical protein
MVRIHVIFDEDIRYPRSQYSSSIIEENLEFVVPKTN